MSCGCAKETCNQSNARHVIMHDSTTDTCALNKFVANSKTKYGSSVHIGLLASDGLASFG